MRRNDGPQLQAALEHDGAFDDAGAEYLHRQGIDAGEDRRVGLLQARKLYFDRKRTVDCNVEERLARRIDSRFKRSAHPSICIAGRDVQEVVWQT